MFETNRDSRNDTFTRIHNIITHVIYMRTSRRTAARYPTGVCVSLCVRMRTCARLCDIRLEMLHSFIYFFVPSFYRSHDGGGSRKSNHAYAHARCRGVFPFFDTRSETFITSALEPIAHTTMYLVHYNTLANIRITIMIIIIITTTIMAGRVCSTYFTNV